MQQLGKFAVGWSAPQGAANRNRHQRNTASPEDVACGLTPTIERGGG
jgi:hypothetical protein